MNLQIRCLAAACLAVGLAICLAGRAQTAPGSGGAEVVWNALQAGAMDSSKFAHTENVTIVRDRMRLTLVDGTIQLTQPANGVVFGAVFRGNGRLEMEPPNGIETQQLQLFTKQPKLEMPFNDATFSFTDSLA
jgi:hypothetical protein